MATGFISASDTNVLDEFSLAFGDLADHSLTVETIASGSDPGITFPVDAITLDITNQGWAYYTLTNVPQAENLELVGRVRSVLNTTGDMSTFSLRIRDSDSALYNVGLSTSKRVRVRWRRPFDTFRGSIADIDTGVANATFSWLRARVNGSDLKFKKWSPDEAEPAAWTWEGTNTSVTGAGSVGISAFADLTFEWLEIGWATDGDTAPTEAPAATIPTLSAPGVTDIGSTSVRPQITLTF